MFVVLLIATHRFLPLSPDPFVCARYGILTLHMIGVHWHKRCRSVLWLIQVLPLGAIIRSGNGAFQLRLSSLSDGVECSG